MGLPLNRALLAVLLLALGCRPGAGYVAADRATHDAIAPEYSAYVEADQALDSDEKRRRQDTVRSWSARLDQAEGKGDPAPGGAGK